MNQNILSVDEKLKLVREVGEEITTIDELKDLLSSDKELIAYDGFEPSGKMHIAQGLLRAVNINKITKAGIHFKMLVSDWTAWANHKYGGDLEKIQTVGNYFTEVWKASGMNLDLVEFVWASDLVKTPGYWETVMRIAIINNLPRIIRTVEIMGRSETDSLSASQILYPLIQTADIFTLGVDITQLGMDQRKVNMLAREVAPQLGYQKPVVISHHLLLGLLPPENKKDDEGTVDRGIRLKMSKSRPDSAIFMTDSADEVVRKIKNAWCPEGVVTENPILEYFKYLVFEKETSVTVNRKPEHGGNLTFKDYAELETLYSENGVHPLDLKITLAELINAYLDPVRQHFSNDKRAKELKAQVDSFAVTR